MTQDTTQIRELGPDDRVRVTLDDRTELRCMAQNERNANYHGDRRKCGTCLRILETRRAD
jgi:hypothetical protein